MKRVNSGGMIQIVVKPKIYRMMPLKF